MKYAINRSRLHNNIMNLSEIGRTGETGVCRLAHSREDRQAVDWVKGWMEAAGLTTRIDAFGNLIGRLEGRFPDAPVLMVGSHIDTQPYGGRYDGTVGVLGGLEAVQTMIESGYKPAMPIEVVSFSDEEGTRFGKGLFGVRGMLGQLEEGELERTDANGITRRQALLEFGGDPAKFKESEYAPGTIGMYLELHIEQGPVLESLGEPIGIVTGISGPLWLTVELRGFAGHAGSVPMHLRKDALVGAARVINEVRRLARSEAGAPTVGTVGSLEVFPNSRNIIPEHVRFTIDLRDIDHERRLALEKQLIESIHKIAEEEGLSCSIREDMSSAPRYCAPGIMEAVRASAGEIGLNPPELMSGPFHDALAMSHCCDYGMIFVRCKDGISHNPQEYASEEDIAIGTEVLYRTLLKLSDARKGDEQDAQRGHL